MGFLIGNLIAWTPATDRVSWDLYAVSSLSSLRHVLANLTHTYEADPALESIGCLFLARLIIGAEPYH